MRKTFYAKSIKSFTFLNFGIYFSKLVFYRLKHHLLSKYRTQKLVQYSLTRWRQLNVENFSIFYEKNFLYEFYKKFHFLEFRYLFYESDILSIIKRLPCILNIYYLNFSLLSRKAFSKMADCCHRLSTRLLVEINVYILFKIYLLMLEANDQGNKTITLMGLFLGCIFIEYFSI